MLVMLRVNPFHNLWQISRMFLEIFYQNTPFNCPNLISNEFCPIKCILFLQYSIFHNCSLTKSIYGDDRPHLYYKEIEAIKKQKKISKWLYNQFYLKSPEKIFFFFFWKMIENSSFTCFLSVFMLLALFLRRWLKKTFFWLSMTTFVSLLSQWNFFCWNCNVFFTKVPLYNRDNRLCSFGNKIKKNFEVIIHLFLFKITWKIFFFFFLNGSIGPIWKLHFWKRFYLFKNKGEK